MNKKELILTLVLATASITTSTVEGKMVEAENQRQVVIQQQLEMKKEAEQKALVVKQRIEKERQLELEAQQKAIAEVKVKEDRKRQVALSRGGHAVEVDTFRATAYTLDAEDCGKSPGDKDFGITTSGMSLRGLDFRAKKIAADPNILPLGSRVWIEFPEDIRYIKFEGQSYDLNGEWSVVDTGGAIQGNRIDVFFGYGRSYTKLANIFGVRRVKIYK